ncbi:MAG: sulfurtransferase TusA [Porticoccaceae bacterium]|jgi:tRNA 2-thiouridine synthesizing protein A|nr:sulfurtransferase TusA [Porticoccaceae bacterium]
MKVPSDHPEALASDFDILLDTSGLMCPEPVMMLHGAVRDVASGEVIKVVATDPSTERDIPKFCQFLNHELLVQGEENGLYIFLIRRG